MGVCLCVCGDGVRCWLTNRLAWPINSNLEIKDTERVKHGKLEKSACAAHCERAPNAIVCIHYTVMAGLQEIYTVIDAVFSYWRPAGFRQFGRSMRCIYGFVH